MVKETRTPDDFDNPWKGALQYFLPAFLAYFFPDIAEEIDWSHGYEPLDKEFQQIVRDAEVGKVLADKLFKVWLRDGTEHWLLIHIEIQGEPEADFPRRMFDYNCAIRQLYNQEVVSLAVLCDERRDWRPTAFSYGRWGCRMELTFRIAKLLDHAEDKQVQEAENPFAPIVTAHLQTLATRNDPAARRASKFRLVKRLLRGNHTKEDVRLLFGLIDWLMTLPDDLEEAFRRDVHQLEEEQHVEYMNTFERHGFKLGREEGREEGVRLGLLEGIALTLEAKFGAAGRRLLKKARALTDIEELRKFGRTLKSARSVKQAEAYFN